MKGGNMNSEKIFEQILENLDETLSQSSPQFVELWNEFIKIHPADLAEFIGSLDKSKAKKIFVALPRKIKLDLFAYASDTMKVLCLSLLPEQERSSFLSSLPLDELTDLFDDLSDEDLKKYLKLLHKRDREKVISLMKFDPESAGGIMHTDILTLMQDFTIEKSIKILQRLRPNVTLHRVIYVTTQENELVGHITLEDLVLMPPQTKLQSIIKKDELVVKADEDREKIAQEMVKYKLSSVPVISDSNIFLGMIDSEELADIIEQEAAEDVYKISALTPIKHTYFETPFLKLYYQRATILSILLLIQTFSSIVSSYYEVILVGFIRFLTMIASTGGNASGQTSVLAIQGLISGEISPSNMARFLKRELYMAMAIGATLGVISFIRVFITNPTTTFIDNLTISVSLAAIVVVSVMLGGIVPLMLKKFKMDPALSAGPFLATIMDIVGILIFCLIGKFMIGI